MMTKEQIEMAGRLFQEIHDKSTALHSMLCLIEGQVNSSLAQSLSNEAYQIVSASADSMGHIFHALELLAKSKS